MAEDAPAREATSRFYHPELDILRFFAFFAVFCHHALPHEYAAYTALHIWPWLGRLLAGAARWVLLALICFLFSARF